MRTLTAMIAVFFFASMTMFAQAEIPPEVEETFNNRFPAAEDVEWEMEEEVFEAEFELNGMEMSALFSEQGEWLETETALTTDQLPDAIKKAIQEEMEDYEITGAESIETNAGDITYEVAFEQDEKSVEIVFSAGGEIIKKEVSDEEDEEEDDD